MNKANELSNFPVKSFKNVSGKKIGIVTSQWNDEITNALKIAANSFLLECGIDHKDIYNIAVPGTFELPLGAKIINRKYQLDGIICLGCVIKGETDHNKYINDSVANALQQLNILLEKPVIFGVLTPNTKSQAVERAGGKYGNKGIEAAATVLRMIELNSDSNNKKIGF